MSVAAKDYRILKFDEVRTLIRARDVPNGMERSTYLLFNNDPDGSPPIARIWETCRKDGLNYKGPVTGDAFCTVPTSELRAKYPKWFRNDDALLTEFTIPQRIDTAQTLDEGDRAEASKLWSEELRNLQKKSIEHDKTSERNQVLCQGTHPDDLEPHQA